MNCDVRLGAVQQSSTGAELENTSTVAVPVRRCREYRNTLDGGSKPLGTTSLRYSETTPLYRILPTMAALAAGRGEEASLGIIVVKLYTVLQYTQAHSVVLLCAVF